METATEILVIITSSVLCVFLLLAIAATIVALRIMKSIKRVVARAEDVLETAEEAAETFRNVSGKLSLLKLVQNIISMANSHKKK
jgi:hypothetical protein